jgi:hypothetical protein
MELEGSDSNSFGNITSVFPEQTEDTKKELRAAGASFGTRIG